MHGYGCSWSTQTGVKLGVPYHLRYHILREAVEDQRISVTYIPTEENIADIFMKALPRPKLMQLVGMLGLRKILKKGTEVEGSTRQ